MRNELELETRWPLLLASWSRHRRRGRSLWSLVIEPWLQRRALRADRAERARSPPSRPLSSRWFTPFALGFVVVYPILHPASSSARRAR